MVPWLLRFLHVLCPLPVQVHVQFQLGDLSNLPSLSHLGPNQPLAYFQECLARLWSNLCSWGSTKQVVTQCGGKYTNATSLLIWLKPNLIMRQSSAAAGKMSSGIKNLQVLCCFLYCSLSENRAAFKTQWKEIPVTQMIKKTRKFTKTLS